MGPSRLILVARRSIVRNFATSSARSADFSHVIIGGGVVGLAIARQLALRPSTSVLLLEKHRDLGTETSSRNSCVIHAGLYYPLNSLKTELCLQGKALLYETCEKFRIPFANCGKWIIAQDESQRAHLEKLHAHANDMGVPTSWLSLDEAKREEPDVLARTAVLNSESTGIVDGHELMTWMTGEFEEAGGSIAVGSHVSSVEAKNGGKGGYGVRVDSGDANKRPMTITTECLINSAGLAACDISNMLLPPERHVMPQYAKGTYFSYTGPRIHPKTLVYPCPVEGSGGLGTHLTIDLAGQVRFGPDVAWVDSPDDYSIIPNEHPQVQQAFEAVSEYLPGIKRENFQPDYCGIRPKLSKPGVEPKKDSKSKAAVEKGPVVKEEKNDIKGGDGGDAGGTFQDFIIREEPEYSGFVNLLGIESPGLTSSLAIGKRVEELLHG